MSKVSLIDYSAALPGAKAQYIQQQIQKAKEIGKSNKEKALAMIEEARQETDRGLDLVNEYLYKLQEEQRLSELKGVFKGLKSSESTQPLDEPFEDALLNLDIENSITKIRMDLINWNTGLTSLKRELEE